MNNQKRQRGRPKSVFKESSAGTLQSLDRALGVLTVVARSEGATLTDIALTVGIPTATTHRILTTLRKHDFVFFDEERQVWMIGVEAYRTGAAFLKRSNLAEVGRALMRQLMAETGETANLAIPDGPEVVFVGQIETNNPIRAFFPPGTRTSMHASGTGKALLSTYTEEKVTNLLLGAGLTVFTDQTLVTPQSLFDDLARTRGRGWSFDREERYVGMSCIGSAIFDENEQAIAGVSISGPSNRFDDTRVAKFGPSVAEAAVEITRLTGGIMPRGWGSQA